MNLSRRTFILGAGAGTAASLLGKVNPSKRVTVGVIGIGRQTVHVNLPQFFKMPEVQVTALCDVDSWRLDNAKKQVEDAYAKQSASGMFKGSRPTKTSTNSLPTRAWMRCSSGDRRLACSDVDGGDQGRQGCFLREAYHALHRRWPGVERFGEETRARFPHRQRIPLPGEFPSRRHPGAQRRIGKLHTIRTGVPQTDIGCPPQPDMPVPPELDYERWQGPAIHAPYTEKRVHTPKSYDRPGWMRHEYYCDGMITNWGAHLNDIAQWGNGTDRTGPIEVEAHGTYPPADSFWNVLLSFQAEYRFANGVRLFYKTDEKVYVRFEGSEGWIFAEYLKPLQADGLHSQLPRSATKRFTSHSKVTNRISSMRS